MSTSAVIEDDSFSNQSIEYSNESVNNISFTSTQPYNILSPSDLSRVSSSYLSSPLSNQNINNIKVICRFRPQIQKESRKGGKVVVQFPNPHTVTLNTKDFVNHYSFDRVFEPSASQSDIFDYSIEEIVDDLLNGYNGTVLAYGQTGSGKTYTMLGTGEQQGIIPRISNEIFKRIALIESNEIEYSISVSFMELYIEQIKDLIEPSIEHDKFSIIEDKVQGIYVKGLTTKFVSCEIELLDILNMGLRNRSTSSTDMNEESSRSHTIFQIKLEQKHVETEVIKRSNLFLVDLAGSEKIDKTGAHGQTLQEAKKINSSLSALGNVINALTDGKSTHIPYRDSKLTRILQESLGGNSRTSLIINCSPSSLHEMETLSTLRFGTRAKSIKNSAHINTEVSSSSLKNRITQLEKINDQNHSYIKQLEDELSTQRSSYHQHHSSSPSFSLGTIGSTNLNRKISKENFQSRIPQQSNLLISSPNKVLSQSNQPLIDELERRDKKIEELENVILDLKMQSLKTSHQEESKLFSLENTLHNIGSKLAEVELVNINLRKHLLISEKIIESRDNKINKLKSSLKDQQLLISRETLSFKDRLGEIQSKLEQLNTCKQQEVNLRRQRISMQDGQQERNEVQQQPTPVELDETSNISDILPDPELIDSFDDDDDDKENSGTLIDETPTKKQSITSNQSDVSQKGFSIYSSKKLENNIVNFQQEYVSINEFLEETRRRSLLVSKPATALSPTSTNLNSSDTSGMILRHSTVNEKKSGMNLNIVKPLKSAGAIFHSNS